MFEYNNIRNYLQFDINVFVMLQKKKVLKFTYVTFSRDGHFTIPQFDFYFKFLIPKASKERLILQRNKLGQITRSKVPKALSYN